jgi:serine/threonine protein kinase
MRFSAGDKLGHYEITELIGKGGMGEVYRGVDTRLGRSVAIKVSAREFNDRFEREARAISSLNHPNICTLHDIGPNYLVMEYIEGETLSKIIDRGPLPLDKVLSYAMQIVDALAAAHAKGIIHRDLKPGNIIITRNGVKVLDFGLAKLSSDRLGSESVTRMDSVTDPITRAGAVLGTVYYMAPEQMEGRETGEQSDIFSFGVVLYEMITGQRPFIGDTQAAVMASVLKDPPPSISQRRPTAPRALDRVVRRCLEKKPEDRWHSAHDLKPTLELIDLDAPPASHSSSSGAMPVQVSSRKRWAWPLIGAVALLAALAVVWTMRPTPAPTGRVTRFEVALPPEVEVDPSAFFVRVSPDGSKLAFTSSGKKPGIWIRDLDSVQARQLPGTEGALSPFWSPDSKSLAYGAGNRLMRVDVAGGPPQVLGNSATPVGSGFWTNDGQIVFGGRGLGPLQKVSASGGLPVAVTALAEEVSFHSLPSLLPDGRHFLYLGSQASQPGRGIYSGSLDVKPDQQSRQRIAPAEFGATYAQASNAAGGVLFFVRDGTLMAQPFDSKTLSLSGDAIPIVQQIGVGPAHAHFSVTSSGVLAYRTGAGPNLQPAWVDRQGNIAQRIGQPSANIRSLSLSPDESQVALFRSDVPVVNGLLAGDIWLLDISRNVETRLTTGQSVATLSSSGPTWSPDGKQLAYASGTRLYVKDTGGATEARLVKDVGKNALVTDWTRDGFLIYTSQENKNQLHVFAIAAIGGDPIPVAATNNDEDLATVSPDGRWLAYASTRSGRAEVYVRPFIARAPKETPSGPVIEISANGGAFPKWRSDGKELFFLADDSSIMAVSIDTANGGFRPSAPMSVGVNVSFGAWAPDRNGQRFLTVPSLDQGAKTPITVVTNWEATLKRQ